MSHQIDGLFRLMCEAGASDLHLMVGTPPLVRKDGGMKPLDPAAPVLDGEMIVRLLDPIIPEKNKHEFAEKHDTDFAYEVPGLARFRANIFMDRKGKGAVFRVIPSKILTAEQLGLSQAILTLCKLHKGLVLVTGPTGSGKSTTLCAMIDHVNSTRNDHIITIEDPIEFVHENKLCAINQREVHNHTDSFKAALRAALREDPDIILVGELRDLETVAIAIETAETGHLVFGTLHTQSAPSTIDRIIDVFAAEQQEQVRTQLASALQGVITQTLLPTADGQGRVAALEVLFPDDAVRNLIRQAKVEQIYSVMQTNTGRGMTTLEQSLAELVLRRVITQEIAVGASSRPDQLESLLERAGYDPDGAAPVLKIAGGPLL
jgi:twitching motility protein PilT